MLNFKNAVELNNREMKMIRGGDGDSNEHEPGEGYWGICYVKGEAIMNCPCNEDSDCPDLWGDKPYCGVL